MGICPRCTGKDGAHYMECVVGRLFERLMGADYPWKAPVAPISPAQESAFEKLVAQTEEFEARAATPERVAEMIQAAEADLASELPARDDDYTAEAIDRATDDEKPETEQERIFNAVKAEEPKPAPKPVTDKRATVPMHKGKRGTWRLSDDAKAAIDLFASECLEKGTFHDSILPSRLEQMYNEWCHTVDGPTMTGQVFGRAIQHAGLIVRRQMSDKEMRELGLTVRGQYVTGWRVKGEPAADPKVIPAAFSGGSTRSDTVAAVAQFADECLILGNPAPSETPWNQRTDWVPAYAVHEAYNTWVKEMHPELTELPQRHVTGGMRTLGYPTRQSLIINGTKPMLFYGVKLRPRLNWGQPRVSEVVSSEPEGDSTTAAIREIMKAAKKRPTPEPEPEPTPEPEAPAATVTQIAERRDANNGWHKPAFSGAASSGGQAPVLTLEALEAENATRGDKATNGYVYDGPRPGKEIPKEYREVVLDLLKLPGWRYAPHGNRGKGKPRVWNPVGKMLCLPNTPSDQKGLMATKTMLKNSLGAPL